MLRAWKPVIVLGTLIYSSYGYYQWSQVRKAFHIDNDFSNERLNKLFDDIDKDKSGSITRDELLKALERIGIKMASVKVDAMIKVGDKNHDGNINRNEFLHIFKSVKVNSTINEESKLPHIDINIKTDANYSNVKEMGPLENKQLKKKVSELLKK